MKIFLEHDPKPSDIKQITIGLTKTATPIIAEPKDIKYNPKSVVDAQFSMPYGAAVAVLKRRAFIDEYSMEMIRSVKVKEMMQKIRCVHEPHLDKEFPRKWSVNVTLETKDGKRFSTRVEHPKGDPENPLSWEELISKFCSLVEPVFSKTTQGEIISRVRNLENLTDIHTLTHLLRG